MITNKLDYISSLTEVSGSGMSLDCSGWSLAHTLASATARHVLSAGALLSRASRKAPRNDRNDSFVFAYAAPRTKPPGIPQVVMLFNAKSDSPETAHPFDTGGLNRHPYLRKLKSQLVSELAFPAPWRKDLASYVAALFDGPEDYLRGVAPARPDPLKISDGLPAHDPLFFTWEVKSEERITLINRLVAVLITTDDVGRPNISRNSYQLLFQRSLDNEILLDEVRGDDIRRVRESLFGLYNRVSEVGGWR